MKDEMENGNVIKPPSPHLQQTNSNRPRFPKKSNQHLLKHDLFNPSPARRPDDNKTRLSGERERRRKTRRGRTLTLAEMQESADDVVVVAE